ncbi:MAG: signal peptidase I [Clostridia bacterium]|nr:signal peptidase I [Clostridia bacterium]
MKKTLKRLFSALGVVLVVLLTVLVLLLFVARMQNRPLFLARRALLRISTDSMSPTIEAGDYIRVEKITADDVRVGDVITFYSDDPALGGSLNTHRVIGLNADGTFETKGDNPLAGVDYYPVRREAVVARYARTCPVISRVMNFLRDGAGLIVVLLCFVMMVANYLLPRVLKKKAPPPPTREEQIAAAVEREIARLKAENDPPPARDGDRGDQNL